MIRALLILALWSPTVFAQLPEELSARWDPFRKLTGHWEGSGTGEWGGSRVCANCQFILNGRFVEIRTRVVYLAAETDSAGAVQEDLAIISFDNERKKFILRQFQGRGLVDQAVLDSISPDGKTIQFTSEFLENAAPGWKARTTFEIAGHLEFTYRFEFAPPGKDFERHSEVHFRRKE